MVGGNVRRNVALLDLIEFMLLLRLIDSVLCAKKKCRVTQTVRVQKCANLQSWQINFPYIPKDRTTEYGKCIDALVP